MAVLVGGFWGGGLVGSRRCLEEPGRVERGLCTLSVMGTGSIVVERAITRFPDSALRPPVAVHRADVSPKCLRRGFPCDLE